MLLPQYWASLEENFLNLADSVRRGNRKNCLDVRRGNRDRRRKEKYHPKATPPPPALPETSQTSNYRFKHFPLVNAGITCYSNSMLWATVTVFVCWIVTWTYEVNTVVFWIIVIFIAKIIHSRCPMHISIFKYAFNFLACSVKAYVHCQERLFLFKIRYIKQSSEVESRANKGQDKCYKKRWDCILTLCRSKENGYLLPKLHYSCIFWLVRMWYFCCLLPLSSVAFTLRSDNQDLNIWTSAGVSLQTMLNILL